MISDWAKFRLKPLLYNYRRGERRTIFYLYLVHNLHPYGQESRLIYYVFQIAKLIVIDGRDPDFEQIRFIIKSLQEVNSENSWMILELIELVSYFLKRQTVVELIGSNHSLENKAILRYLYALTLNKHDEIRGAYSSAFPELKFIASLAKKIGMNKAEWMEFKKDTKEEIISGWQGQTNNNVFSKDTINIFKGLDFDKERLFKYADFMNPVMGHWLCIKANMVGEKPNLISLQKNTKQETLSSFHDLKIRLELLQDKEVIKRQCDEVNKLSSLIKFSLGIRAAELDNNIAESTQIALADQLAGYEKVLELSIRDIYEKIKIITQVQCQLEAIKEFIEKAAFDDKRSLVKIKSRLDKTYAHHRKGMEEVIAILHTLLITLGHQHKLKKRFDTDMSRSIKELEFWGDKMSLY